MDQAEHAKKDAVDKMQEAQNRAELVDEKYKNTISAKFEVLNDETQIKYIENAKNQLSEMNS